MIKDLSGKTFSNVYVDKYDGSDKYRHAYFICKCLICGKQFRSLGTNLLSGRTVSCGCIANKNREYGRKKTLPMLSSCYLTQAECIRSSAF